MPSSNIPLVGPTYQARDTSVSDQVTRGFYIETSREASEPFALLQFPGLKNLSSSSGQDRGAGTYNEELYVVSANTLYHVDSLGVKTSIGSIGGGSQCVLVDDGARLVIATAGQKPYSYDGTTLSAGSDVDLPLANTVAYINDRVVYDGSESEAVFADLENPLVVNSANVTRIDAQSDDTVAAYAFNQQLYFMGTRSINPYYATGAGNPPYTAVQNATNTSLGIKSVYSLASNPNFMYFHGSDGQIYRLRGSQPQVISNPAIAQAISKYPDVSKGRGSCFSFDNQNFYYITFPNSGSWLYSEGVGWTNLAHGPDNDASLISRVISVYGGLYATDRRNGNIYKLDFDTWTNDGETIFRQRTIPKITPASLGAPGRRIFIDRIVINLRLGVGILNGQGSNPQIMMDWRNGGKGPWSSERWKSLGELGDTEVQVYWDDLGDFETSGREFRFRVSDPVNIGLYSASMNFEVGEI